MIKLIHYQRMTEGEASLRMIKKLSKRCNLSFHVFPLMVCLMLLMAGCGKEESTGSIFEEKQNTSEERQIDKTSTGVVKDESGSEGSEDMEELPEYVSVVRITINPQLELYLDGEDRVVGVSYLNQDAEDAFSKLSMTDLSLEDAVRQIVTVSVDEGYLTEGKTITVDFVEQDEKSDLSEKMDMVQTAVQEEISEKQLTVTLEIEAEGEVQDSFVLEPDEQKPSEETSSSSGQTGNDKASEAAGTQNGKTPETTGTPEDKQTGKQNGQQTGEQTGTQQAGNSASGSEAAKPDAEPCPDCGGSGICPECGGGTLPCKMCGGSLWESCGVCGGSGRQSCPGCHGSGKDATSGETCRHCGGAGSITCEVCRGAGGKSCSICNGKGVVSDDCILCHGGKACTACGGTGVKK